MRSRMGAMRRAATMPTVTPLLERAQCTSIASSPPVESGRRLGGPGGCLMRAARRGSCTPLRPTVVAPRTVPSPAIEREIVELVGLGLLGHRVAEGDPALGVERLDVALGPLEREVGLVEEGVVPTQPYQLLVQRPALAPQLVADAGRGGLDAQVEVVLDELSRGVARRSADHRGRQDGHEAEGKEEAGGERHGPISIVQGRVVVFVCRALDGSRGCPVQSTSTKRRTVW